MSGERVAIATRPENAFDHPTHLVPLVDELLARGYALARPRGRYDGFVETQGGWMCFLDRPVAPADWEALREKFDIPESITYFTGTIRDNETWTVVGAM